MQQAIMLQTNVRHEHKQIKSAQWSYDSKQNEKQRTNSN